MYRFINPQDFISNSHEVHKICNMKSFILNTLSLFSKILLNIPERKIGIFLIFFLFLASISIVNLFAQDTTSSVSQIPEDDPNVIYKKAEDFQKKNQFFDAYKVYRKAAFLFYPDQNKIPENKNDLDAASWHVKSLINSARNYSLSGRVQDAQDTLKALLPIAQRLLGEGSSSEGRILNALAQGYEKIGDYNASLLFYKKALQLYFNIGGERQTNVALLYYNIGLTYDYMARYDSAMKYKNDKALRLLIDLKGDDQSLDIADVYSSIGVTYDNLADFDNALLYYRKSLTIQIKELGDNDPALAANYDNIGVAYDRLGDFQNARKNKAKALSLRQSRPGPDLANSYLNMGQIYSKEKKYEDAEKSYQNAINIFQQYGDELNMAACYFNMANDLESQKKFSPALSKYESSLKIRKKLLGNKHQLVADTYIGLGFVYQRSGDMLKSLRAFQDALCSVVVNFNDSTSNKNPNFKDSEVLSYNTYFKALRGKTATLFRYAAEYNKGDSNNQLEEYEKSLKLADATFQLAHNVMLEVRKHYRGDLAKLRWADESYQLYDDAISVSQKLALLYDLKKEVPPAQGNGNYVNTNNNNLNEKRNNNPYLERIFTISEYSKASILQLAIQEAKIRKEESSKIPFDIQIIEKKITIELGNAHKSYVAEIIKGVRANKDKVRQLQSQIFQLKKSHDSLIKKIEDDYPIYANQKYNVKDAKVKDAQDLIKNVLSADGRRPAFVEFFTGDSLLSIIYISSESYKIQSLNYDKKELLKKIEMLRSGIISLDGKRFTKPAFELYKLLLEPIQSFAEKDNVSQLIIIPDNFLCYLPFETLLRDQAPRDTTTNYSELSYLVKKYAVSYAYSFNLVEDDTVKKTHKKLFAMAPVFKDNDQAVFGRKIVTTLAASENEVIKIQKIARDVSKDSSGSKQETAIYINSDATKDKIQSDQISDYEIIHLATHGFVYPETPERSGVLLYPKEGKDGMLYCNDIVSLNLNADLVTLSACETGLGKVQRGEGIVGLTRAFFSAGASNVIVSLWSVADESTAQLMESFYSLVFKAEYKYKKQGNKIYGEALKRAKIKMISDSKFSAPFYWAPFILIE